MGYTTTYYGVINLSEEGFEIIKENWDKFTKEFDFDMPDIELNWDFKKIEINNCWKDYDEVMLKFCKAVSMLDKKATGSIECRGEEQEDMWKIEIKPNKVESWKVILDYEVDNEDYSHYVSKKIVYDITKDESLAKELMVEKLENA